MNQKVIYIETTEPMHKAVRVASSLENKSLSELGREAIKDKLSKLAKKHPALKQLIETETALAE
jgi:hypothetical protein